jgi:hypothetical protein
VTAVKERRKHVTAHKYDTEHIKEEIARLTRKQRSVEETIARATADDQNPPDELLHLEAEVSLRLEQKRRQLLQVFQVLKRRQVCVCVCVCVCMCVCVSVVFHSQVGYLS